MFKNVSSCHSLPEQMHLLTRNLLEIYNQPFELSRPVTVIHKDNKTRQIESESHCAVEEYFW